MYDSTISPVGWYVGTYQLRLLNPENDNENLESRFRTWENTVLVKAKDLDEAYKKLERIGKRSSRTYKGGPDGVIVQWQYEGIVELLPVYEELEDGNEIMWRDRTPRKLKTIRSSTISIEEARK